MDAQTLPLSQYQSLKPLKSDAQYWRNSVLFAVQEAFPASDPATPKWRTSRQNQSKAFSAAQRPAKAAAIPSARAE